MREVAMEYAEDIVLRMNIDRAAQADKSFARFVEGLRDELRGLES